MEGNTNAGQEFQLQKRITRIAEGTLMLDGTLAGLWLIGVLIYSFLK